MQAREDLVEALVGLKAAINEANREAQERGLEDKGAITTNDAEVHRDTMSLLAVSGTC